MPSNKRTLRRQQPSKSSEQLGTKLEQTGPQPGDTEDVGARLARGGPVFPGAMELPNYAPVTSDPVARRRYNPKRTGYAEGGNVDPMGYLPRVDDSRTRPQPSTFDPYNTLGRQEPQVSPFAMYGPEQYARGGSVQPPDIEGYMRGDRALPPEHLDAHISQTAAANPGLDANDVHMRAVTDPARAGDLPKAAAVLAGLRRRHDSLNAHAQGAAAHGDLVTAAVLADRAHEHVPDGRRVRHFVNGGAVTVDVKPGRTHRLTGQQFHNHLAGLGTDFDHLMTKGMDHHLGVASGADVRAPVGYQQGGGVNDPMAYANVEPGTEAPPLRWIAGEEPDTAKISSKQQAGKNLGARTPEWMIRGPSAGYAEGGYQEGGEVVDDQQNAQQQAVIDEQEIVKKVLEENRRSHGLTEDQPAVEDIPAKQTEGAVMPPTGTHLQGQIDAVKRIGEKLWSRSPQETQRRGVSQLATAEPAAAAAPTTTGAGGAAEDRTYPGGLTTRGGDTEPPITDLTGGRPVPGVTEPVRSRVATPSTQPVGSPGGASAIPGQSVGPAPLGPTIEDYRGGRIPGMQPVPGRSPEDMRTFQGTPSFEQLQRGPEAAGRPDPNRAAYDAAAARGDIYTTPRMSWDRLTKEAIPDIMKGRLLGRPNVVDYPQATAPAARAPAEAPAEAPAAGGMQVHGVQRYWDPATQDFTSPKPIVSRQQAEPSERERQFLREENNLRASAAITRDPNQATEMLRQAGAIQQERLGLTPRLQRGGVDPQNAADTHMLNAYNHSRTQMLKYMSDTGVTDPAKVPDAYKIHPGLQNLMDDYLRRRAPAGGAVPGGGNAAPGGGRIETLPDGRRVRVVD